MENGGKDWVDRPGGEARRLLDKISGQAVPVKQESGVGSEQAQSPLEGGGSFSCLGGVNPRRRAPAGGRGA